MESNTFFIRNGNFESKYNYLYGLLYLAAFKIKYIKYCIVVKHSRHGRILLQFQKNWLKFYLRKGG